MEYTVPTNLPANPLIVTINGVSYSLGAGETVTVPSEVKAEVDRMIGSWNLPAPAVPVPFTDAAVYAAVDALDTAVESARVLPEYPEEDGTYTTQLVVADEEATLTWESAETPVNPEI